MYTASPLYTNVNFRKKTVMPYSSYTTCYNKKTKIVTNSIRFNHSKLSDNGNNNANTSKNSLIYNNEHYLDVSYEQSDLNIKPEPVPIKAIDSSEMSNLSSCPDNKLSYTLITLGLGHLVKKKKKNMITFNDLLLLTKEDLEEVSECGYRLESYRKMDLENGQSFDSLFFMEEKIKPEALERAVPRLFSDKSCGEVFRIKGFVKNGAGQWMELNATPDSHTMQSVAVGQEVLIVIGEHLQEDKIREILKEEETCQS